MQSPFSSRKSLSSRQALAKLAKPRRNTFAIGPIEVLEERAVPATLYWLGTAGSNWDSDSWTNTSGGTAVAALRPQVNDTLRFETAQANFVANIASFTLNNDSPVSLTGLAIVINDGSAVGDFSFGGSGITTGASGISNTVTDGTAATFNLPIALGANQPFTNTAGSTTGRLVIAGGVTGTGNLTLTNSSTIGDGITLSTAAINNVGTITNSGVGTGSTLISAAIGTNVTSLTQNTANSTLTLSGANSYTGLTSILVGQLKLGAPNAINSGNNLTTAANGILDLNGNSQTLGLLTHAGNVTNTGGGTPTLTIGDGSAGAGSFTGLMNLIWNQGVSSTSLTGTTLGMTGTLTLNANGAGTITFGTSNHIGPVVNSGSGGGGTTLTTVGSNVTSVTQSANTVLTFTNVPGNAGGINIYNGSIACTSNSNTFGANTLFLGDPTPSNSNSATINFANVNGTNANNPIVVNAGSSGTLTIITPNTAAFSGNITLNNNVTVIENSTVAGKNITLSGTITTGTAAVTLTGNNGGSSTAGVVLSGSVVVGNGGLTLANIANGGILNVTGSVTGTGNLILNNNNVGTINVSGVINNTGSVTNSGNSTGVTTISGIIGVNVAGGVTQNSAGSVLVLSGSNTWSSGLNIQQGTARLGNANAAGFGVVTIGNAGTSGILDLNGASRNILGLATAGVAANQVVGNGAGSAATLNYVGTTSSTFGGTIQDIVAAGTSTVAVTVNNPLGSLTLSGANTYTGTTTITAGTLIASGTNSAAAGATVLGGGTLQLNNASNGGLAGGLLSLSGGTLQSLLPSQALANVISLTASSTISGSNSITLNGDLTQTASTTLTSSITGGQLLTLAGNVNIDNVTGTALTLTIGGTGPTTITGLVRDYSGGFGTAHGNLTINNSNTTTLTQAATHGGTTTVNRGGTLKTPVSSSSSPFGANSITPIALANGSLNFAPTGSGSAIAYTNVGGTFTIGSAGVTLNKGSQTSVSATLGSGAPTRSAGGLLIISPSTTGTLGTTEKLLVTTGPIPVSGMVLPFYVAQGATTAGAGDFLTYAGGTGFSSVTTYGDTNFAAPTNAKSEDVTSVQNLNAATAVYALRTNAQINLTSSTVLSVGVSASASPAGIILNGGAGIAGGFVAFGASEGIIYAFGSPATVSSNITGTNGLTIGGNNTVTLSANNVYTGTTIVTSGALSVTGSINPNNAVTVNGGTLNLNAGNAISGTSTLTVGTGTGSILTENAANAIAGNAILTVSGGTATLSNANNFVGATTVGAGTLTLSAANAIRGSAVTLNNAAGVLNLNAANALSGASSLTLASGAGAVNVTQPQNYSGATSANNGTLTISGSGSLTNSAIVFGAGNLNLFTPGAINGGSVTSNSGSPTQTADNTITGTTSVFIQQGWNLSRANNYSGVTTIYGGSNPYTVNGISTITGTALDFSQPLSPISNIINNGISHANIANGSTLALTGGTIYAVGKNGAANSQEFNGLVLNAGLGAVLATPGTSGTMTVTLNGITRNAGGSVVFGGTGTTTTTNANANFAGGQPTILGGWALTGSVGNNATPSETSWAVSAGDGATAGAITALPLASYTPNTGNVFPTNGGNGADIDMSVAGGASVPVSQTINSLRFNNPLAQTVAITNGQTLTIATGGILNTGTVGANNANVITGGSITSGNGQDLVVNTNNGTTNNIPLTINSNIVNNGMTPIGLTATGGQTLVIGGNNTFSGPLTIGTGTVKLGSDTALGGQPSLMISLFGVGAGTFDTNGYSGTISGLNDTLGGVRVGGGINSGLQIVNNGATPSTLTINNAVANTYNGGIKDGTAALSIVKSGAGTLTLTNSIDNNNDRAQYAYTGTTTVNGGTLVFTGSQSGTIGSSELILNTPQGVSFPKNSFSIGSLGGSGSLALVQTDGFGTVALTLNNANAGFVDPNTSTAPNYSGVLSGLGNLVKSGAYTQVLSGANTYFGGTNVSAGTLQLGNARALGLTNATLNVSASGAVVDLRGFNASVGALSGAAGALIRNDASASNSVLTVGVANTSGTYSGSILDHNIGTGTVGVSKVGSLTQTLASSNTYTGGTTVTGVNNAGTLTGTASGVGVTPFGTGSITMNGGILAFSPAAAGGTTAFAANSNAANTFTYDGTAQLKLTRNTAVSPLTVTIGGGGANPFVRNGKGVLLIVPSATTTLGAASNGEQVLINGTAPTITNGMVSPTIAGLGAATAGIIDWLTYDNTLGFKAATYTRSISTAQTVTTNANELLFIAPTTGQAVIIQDTGNHAYALTVNGSNATPTVTGTVTLGNGTGQAGLSLNGTPGGGTVNVLSGGTISFGAAEGVVMLRSGGAYLATSTVLAGTGGVTLAGDNSAGITFSSGNTFSGGLTINSGATLSAGTDNTFGDAANTVTLNGGGFYGNLVNNIISTGRALVVNAPGALFDANNHIFAYAGNITGTGVITMTGVGSSNPVVLSGNNTYGGVNLSSGTLNVATDANLGGANSAITIAPTSFGATATLSILGNSLHDFGSHPVTFGGNNSIVVLDIQNPNNTFTLNQPLSLSGVSTFTKTGLGSLSVAAPYNFASTTNVNGGTLTIDATQGGSLGNVPITLSGGALTLLGKTTGTSQTLGNVTVNAGGGTIRVNSNTSGTTTLTLGSITATAAGGTVNIVPQGTTPANSIVRTTTFNDGTGGDGIVGNGRVVYNGADWARASAGVSPYALGGYSGYSPLALTAGTDVNNSRITASATLGAGSTTTNTLKIESPAASQSLTVGAGNTLALTAGGLLYTGSNAFSIDTAGNAGTLKSGTPTNSDLIVHQYGSGDLTINSVIANGFGTSTLTTAGTGKVILTAANTYTGATFVNGGTLSVSAINQLGATANSAINLHGGTLQYTGGGTASTTHPIALGGSGGSIDLTGGTTLTASGVISGTTLTVNSSDNSASTLILAGSNTFNDGLTINGGTVRLTTAASLQGVGWNTVSFGSGTTETLQLNGNSPTLAGLVSASANAVVENGNSSATPVTLTINNGDNQTYAGVIQQGTATGAVSVTKGGGGTWTLSGTNTYLGQTRIQNGAVSVSSIGSVGGAGSNLGAQTTPTNATIALGIGATAATLIYTGGNEITDRIINLAGLSGGATIDQSGTGFVQFTGNVTAAPSSSTAVANAADKTLTLKGSTAGTGELAGTIVDSTVTGGGSGDTALAKSGTGAWTLSGVNTYSGGTTVTAGTLFVNNATGSGTGAGSVAVNGGTLGGGGFITGATTISAAASISPGLANAIGTLSIANTLVLAGNDLFDINASDLSRDRVIGVTDLTYGGTLKITNFAGTFAAGQSWDLFDFLSNSGTFANDAVFGTSGDGVNLPNLGPALKWQFEYASGTLSIASNLAAPTVTSVVPAIGPTTGGTLVVITGTNFVSITSVTVAGTPLATFTVSGTTQITITTPAHAAGAVDVVVSNGGGSGSLVGSNDFTYATPAIASVVVNGGPGVVLGGSTWSLTGQNSVVKQILVTFNQAVSLASDAFTVTSVPVSVNPGPGVVIVNGGAAPSTAAVTAVISATLSPSSYLVTFSGPGTHAGNVINSGVYDLTTIASKVSANGETMASNRVDTFFAMFGTINANDSLTSGYIGDGFSNAFVDPGSLFQFSDAFGSSAATPVGPPAYNIVFDSNLDGFIDPGDLFAFSDSFGIDWDF